MSNSSMRLKRAKKPPAVKNKPYKLLKGTPTDTAIFPQEFATLGEVKSAARKVFAEWLRWRRQYPVSSNPGALEAAIERIDLFTGSTRDKFEVEAAFDPISGMVARVTIWREG